MKLQLLLILDCMTWYNVVNKMLLESYFISRCSRASIHVHAIMTKIHGLKNPMEEFGGQNL